MKPAHVPALACLFLSSCLAATAHAQSNSFTPPSTDPAHLADINSGTISHNTYHNSDLGFTYEFPSGWTANDKAVQSKAIIDGTQFAWADDFTPRRKHTDVPPCSKGLLVATEHPEDMVINHGLNASAILIAADPKCLNSPFPATAKDQAAIQQVAGSIGIYFKSPGARGIGSPRIRAFEDAGRLILEVSQQYGLSNLPSEGSSSYKTIYTSIMIMKARKYWLMWMYASSDPGKLDILRKSKVYFDGPPE